MNLNEEVIKFVDKVDKFRQEYYSKNYSKLKCANVLITEGRCYYKLICDGSVWGFISKMNKLHKGVPIKAGDLLMPAGWNTPAKHSRGNIIDNTATYGVYGPNYLK